MLRETRKTAIGLGLAAAMATSCVYAADGQPLPTPKVNEITQKVWANPDLTEPTKGIRTLQDYIVQEKELWDFLFQNHPIFATYGKDGRVIGTPVISTRGSEYLVKAMLRSTPLIRTATVRWPLNTVWASAPFLTSPTSLWDRKNAANATRFSTNSGSVPVMPRRFVSLENILKSITT